MSQSPPDSAKKQLWMLPEGVDSYDVKQSLSLETRRRKLIDLYQSYGYDYISTPVVEFSEPLLTGASSDLELQTQKLTDQISGRLLGIRADITPQIARYDVLDQHSTGPKRYCYSGMVYHARPSLSSEPTRMPYQIGVELFGHSGQASDMEVLKLLVESLKAIDVSDITLDLGHVGISQALFKSFSESEEEQLRQIFNRKCKVDLVEFLDGATVNECLKQDLLALIDLSGDESVLDTAEQRFSQPGILSILTEFKLMAAELKAQFPALKLFFDLGEMRGYHYHTGIVFAAYKLNESRPIAKGGRYDGLAKLFGRDRAATGFTIDLSHISRLCLEKGVDNSGINAKIYAPASDEESLKQVVAELRQAGEQVITGFDGIAPNFQELSCDRELVQVEGKWQVTAIK